MHPRNPRNLRILLYPLHPKPHLRNTRTAMPTDITWWARGLIFENCACSLVCPGHMHFSQNCTHDRCKGYWALRFDEGTFGGVPLAGTRALIAFDTPQRM